MFSEVKAPLRQRIPTFREAYRTTEKRCATYEKQNAYEFEIIGN